MGNYITLTKVNIALMSIIGAIVSWSKRIKFHIRSFPIMVLMLCVVSFGLFIPWLGYYWDDWPVIVSSYLRGVNFFWQFYSGERPIEGWIYILTIPILGTRPIVWHIFILFMRWVTVLLMWWVVRGLWPQRTREVTWMALLFAVYPAFEQQVFPVNFSAHWITYSLYFLSLGLMIRSLRKPRLAWLWNLLAVLITALHLWTMEYYAGLELLRPLVLWMMVAEDKVKLRTRIMLTMRRWFPYLLVIGIFTFWRLFLLDVGTQDPNEPKLLSDLVSQPFSAGVRLFQFAVQDFINIIFGAWYKTIAPETFDLSDRLVLFTSLLSLLIIVLSSLYLMRLKYSSSINLGRSLQRNWLKQALLFGFLAVLLGPFPVWLTNRWTIWGLYGSRFAIASMFGASVLWVAILEWITIRRLPKLLILCGFLGLAIGYHIRWTNNFRWIWKDELRFYWQLYWRAPYLKPGSTIASDGEFFPYVGRNATALGINLLYPQSNYPGIDYWFYEIAPGFVRFPDEMKKGKDIQYSFRKFKFTGSTLDTVFITYESEKGQCLWVLSPQDKDNPEINPMLADALPISNLDRIEPQAKGIPLEAVFGLEPDHDWCYYFQKADLARQYFNWQEVVRLGDEAKKQGHSPNNPQEWLPFIEGYAMAGRWDDAIEITLHVRQVNRFLSPRICRFWEGILANSTPSNDFNAGITSMFNRLECESAP